MSSRSSRSRSRSSQSSTQSLRRQIREIDDILNKNGYSKINDDPTFKQKFYKKFKKLLAKKSLLENQEIKIENKRLQEKRELQEQEEQKEFLENISQNIVEGKSSNKELSNKRKFNNTIRYKSHLKVATIPNVEVIHEIPSPDNSPEHSPPPHPYQPPKKNSIIRSVKKSLGLSAAKGGRKGTQKNQRYRK
jgi:hypothetical protein